MIKSKVTLDGICKGCFHPKLFVEEPEIVKDEKGYHLAPCNVYCENESICTAVAGRVKEGGV